MINRIADGGWGFTYLVTDQDRLWFDEGMRRGWRLPGPARPFWRMWGIRHVRWAIQLYRVWQWNRRWEQLDVTPTGFEDWLCYAIWRGWC